MRKLIISIASTISLCLSAVLLNITTPASAGPFGILAILFFSYVFIFGFVSFVIFSFSFLISLISSVFMPRRPIMAMSFRRSSYFATIAAAAIVMIIGLQSVGRVGFYEYILVSFFIVVGCIYIYKKIP